MAGTNLNSATSAYAPTLWIRETQPTAASSSGDFALAISATCTGVPPTTTNTFAHGCLMLQQDTTTGTTALFENTGSASSVVWTSLATSAPGTIALTNTHLLVGNASNVATDVAASGDLTVSNTGAFTIANSAVTTVKINAAAVTGAKLVTGVGYFSVAQITNGTTPVNVIAATVPFNATITGVYLISNDTTAGNITLADTAGTVATIAKGTSSGVMVGAVSLANTAITSGNTLTIVSSSAGNATVFVTFTVA